MERFGTKALQRRVTQLGNVILYIALTSSVSLAKGGAQSVAVEREVTGNGKEVEVVKSLKKKEQGLDEEHTGTGEPTTQDQSIGDRKRPFEDVVQSEPSDSQESKKIPERWDED